MPVQNQETLGDRLFQLRDYKGAVKRFENALARGETARNLHYRIYNKKASAFIKLEKYDAAIRDAGESIRLAPDIAEGYLLVSQALQLKTSNERAIQILEAGLNRVKSGGPRWQKITKHLDSARTRLNLLDKRRDFLDPNKVRDFPLELVFLIFGFLDPKDILRCERVSKHWKTVIRSNPQFYQSLEIRSHIPSPSLNRWLNLTENSPYKLQTLSLKLWNIQEDALNARTKNLFGIARACKQLKSLKLHIENKITKEIHDLYPAGSNTLKKLVLDGRGGISMTDIQEMVKLLPALEHAEFHCVTKGRGNLVVQWPPLPHLKTVYLLGDYNHAISRDMPETMLGINKLIVAAPNVKDAVIRNFGISCAGANPLDFGAWKILESLDIHKLRMAYLPTFPQTLRHLTLSDIATVSHAELNRAKKADGTIDASLFHMPDLFSLNLQGSDFSHFTYELSLAGLESGTLKVLKIGDTSHFATHDDPYIHWPIRMPRPSAALRELSLKSLSHITEDVVIRLLEQYPNLKEVDVSNCHITGTTLRKLFERENKPWNIDVTGCANVSRDAIEAARHHGIDVYSEHRPQKEVYSGHKHDIY